MCSFYGNFPWPLDTIIHTCICKLVDNVTLYNRWISDTKSDQRKIIRYWLSYIRLRIRLVCKTFTCMEIRKLRILETVPFFTLLISGNKLFSKLSYYENNLLENYSEIKVWKKTSRQHISSSSLFWVTINISLLKNLIIFHDIYSYLVSSSLYCNPYANKKIVILSI